LLQSTQEAAVRQLALLIAASLVGALAGARLSQARPDDRTFILEQHDRLVAEAPGCYASCHAMGAVRSCTVREFECHAVCTVLPECKPDGFRPIRVCAVVRDR
jgi:hypothetical protein